MVSKTLALAPRLASLLLIALLAEGVSLARASDSGDTVAYERAIAQRREERQARLLAPEGWLSLIGLHWLSEGSNSVGRSPENKIVLRDGPAHWGTVDLGRDGSVVFRADPKVGIFIDGTAADGSPVVLRDDQTEEVRPTRVQAGVVNFHLLDRGGRKGLRVRSENSDTRIHFLGIDYFPVDSAWRIEAEWVPFASPRQQPIRNILGQVDVETVPGEAVFTFEGQTVRMLPVWSGAAEDKLFFVISDATSGHETYSAARFVYADPPKDGKVVLDFNLAVNPPCAFTPYATCPLPPEENQLPFAVRAGEKRYRGEPAH